MESHDTQIQTMGVGAGSNRHEIIADCINMIKVLSSMQSKLN